MMIKLLSKFMLIFGIILFVYACTVEPTQVVVDSINDTLVEEPEPVVVLPLPDTVYPSVDALNYKITILDSLTDGTIYSFENLYENIDGIFTFRGQPSRSPHFSGVVDSVPSKIVIDWTFHTDYDGVQTNFGVWGGGNGWTGQPLYVNWDDEVVKSRITRKVDSTFIGKEIIISSLCGYVYFLDYETGKAKRNKVLIDNPIKGTAMLDPTMNGNLYVGQGVPRTTPFNPRVVNVFDNQVIQDLPKEVDIWRSWNAFDSSPIAAGDFVFWPGENGTIYKYSRDSVGLKLHSKLQYRVGGNSAPGIESSMVVYRNYGFTSDNHGNILCFNLNTMQPVWHYDNLDDTDATPILEVTDDGRVYLYTGCEVDRVPAAGISRFVKLDALTGELVWKQEIPCKKTHSADKSFDGGMFSSPLLGGGNCSDMIFSNFVTNTPNGAGKFVALSKESGEIIYETPLNWYAWSSPVALYNKKGEMFIFTGDTQGRAYVLDGKTGEILVNQIIGLNFEASPIILGNKVIIGSRGTDIFKLSIE